MILTEIPSWSNDLRCFACPRCWESDKVVAIALGKTRWQSFMRNMILLKCPECQFERPKFNTWMGDLKEYWIQCYFTSRQAEMIGMSLMKEPDFKRDEYLHAESLQRPYVPPKKMVTE